MANDDDQTRFIGWVILCIIVYVSLSNISNQPTTDVNLQRKIWSICFRYVLYSIPFTVLADMYIEEPIRVYYVVVERNGTFSKRMLLRPKCSDGPPITTRLIKPIDVDDASINNYTRCMFIGSYLCFLGVCMLVPVCELIPAYSIVQLGMGIVGCILFFIFLFIRPYMTLMHVLSSPKFGEMLCTIQKNLERYISLRKQMEEEYLEGVDA